MLYVFHVDTGRMIKFDMNVALSSVQNLKDMIERLHGLPAANIVLLVSGGEMLTPGSLVCSYSAGTDTNPIYMFSTVDVKPQPWPSIEPDVDLKDQVDRCLTLPATYSTVVTRAQLAQQIYDLAREEEAICERLVHEQHLQQQGWSAVIANMEDLTDEFRQRFENFCKCFEEHLRKRNEYLKLLGQFSDDLDKLARIPILPGLMQNAEEEFHGFDDYLNNDEVFSRSQYNVSVIAVTPKSQNIQEKNELTIESSSNEESKNNDSSNNEIVSVAEQQTTIAKIRKLTLLQWISAKENHNTLKIMAEECTQGLSTFDDEKFEKLKQEVLNIIRIAEQEEIKEIKGLEDRLCGLEKLMYELRKLVQEQKELSTAFQQNQNRASNLGDASILPDLCASHRSQLLVMLQNQKVIRDIRRRISRAKDELGANLEKRLKFIVHIENTMSELDNNLLFYHRCLRRVERHLNIIQQIHQTPSIYVAAVTEVVRRRIFSKEFINWASNLACDFYTIHNEEVLRRQEFNVNFEGHFLNALFPGMQDMPPAFANETPFIFDASLPNITKNDLDFLSSYLPDIASKIQFPDMGPVIEFFISRSGIKSGEIKSSETNKSQSNTLPAITHRPIDLHAHLKDGFESETDTEEFEKVGQSSNEQQQSTQVTMTATIATSTSENVQQMITASTSMEIVTTKSAETLTEIRQLSQPNTPKKPPRLSKIVNNNNNNMNKTDEYPSSCSLSSSIKISSDTPDIVPVSRFQQQSSPYPLQNSSSLSLKSSINSQDQSILQLSSSNFQLKNLKIPLSYHHHHQYSPDNEIVGHQKHQKQQQYQQEQSSDITKTTTTTTTNAIISIIDQINRSTEKLTSLSSSSSLTTTNNNMIDDNEFINSEFYIDESLASSLNDDDNDEETDGDNHYETVKFIKYDNPSLNTSKNSENDEIESLNVMQTLDKSTSMSITFNNRKSMEMVLTLLQENLGSTRLEVEQLENVLKNMSKISTESIALLKSDLKLVHHNVIEEKNQMNAIIKEFTIAWTNLKDKYDSYLNDTINTLKNAHKLELDDIKLKLTTKLNDIEMECNDKNNLIASQKETIINLENELTKLHNEITNLTKKIENLQDNINLADVEKEKALNELRERLIHEHKTEIESLRCRFKLMTSMERSPSDTSLEKIEKPDMIEISCHESILLQARENMNNEKELAIKEAVELERLKWISGGGGVGGVAASSSSGTIADDGGIINQITPNVDLLKKIIEEKDKQLDAMRERDTILSKENSQLKIKIESLTNEDESDKIWLKERLEFLNKDKTRLEQELNMEKSRRLEMESSIATMKSSTIVRDVIGSPDLSGTRSSKMSSSQTVLKQQQQQGITIDSCNKDDVVFIVWNAKHGQFMVVQDSPNLYFVHGDSLSALNIKLPNPSDTNDTPFPLYSIVKVVDKEYCQARKDENRYKVTKGTKFYRVKLQPYARMETSRLHHRRDRYASSSSSASVSRSTSTQHLIDSFAQTDSSSSVIHSSSPRDTVDSATGGISTITVSSSVTQERTMSVCSVAEEEDEPISLLGERCHYTSLSEEDEKECASLITTTVTSCVSSSTSTTTLISSTSSTNQQQQQQSQQQQQTIGITTTISTESSSEKDQDDSDEYRSLEAKDESDFTTAV